MKEQYELIIFDMDGTLVETISGAKFRQNAQDWKVLPGRQERLQQLHEQGIILAIASNQGGVAFGYMRSTQLEEETQNLAGILNIDYYELCFEHPNASIEDWKADSPNRKPAPGMLLTLMKRAGVHALDTLMVGDREEDRAAAQNAGVDFMEASEFFKLDQQPESPKFDRLKAIETLLDGPLTDGLQIIEVGEKRLHLASHLYGGSKYHLIDYVDYNNLTVIETDIDEKWDKKLTFKANQLPQVLQALLRIYLEIQEEKDTQPLDDHPF